MRTNGTYMDILKIKLLSNDYLNIDKAFIRGSYANGNYNYKSDLDLLIISDDFIGIDMMKRKQLVKNIFEPILCMKIDSICLTKYEYGLIVMNKEKDIRYDEMVEVI
ncbi:nucleotidyltransferase domain-containing protein [Clostridium sporogenes]|uniref:nucleotidyltransferase domain-containing protein n=1 Tax=Clostridium sporogenes TaxID=1509 RepID=UPI0013D73820|nr:nucleotidyltransferase domain-containing protein [Clostridium sporogenes]NFQ67417.1 nucleotidyltransferase domain-containing protein [Clostridium sporogenes]